jgi:hypothetical protein
MLRTRGRHPLLDEFVLLPNPFDKAAAVGLNRDGGDIIQPDLMGIEAEAALRP